MDFDVSDEYWLLENANPTRRDLMFGTRTVLSNATLEKTLSNVGLSSFSTSCSTDLFRDQLVADVRAKRLIGTDAHGSTRRTRVRRNNVMDRWTRYILADVLTYVEKNVSRDYISKFKTFMNWKISLFDWTMDVINVEMEYINLTAAFNNSIRNQELEVQFPMEDPATL